MLSNISSQQFITFQVNDTNTRSSQSFVRITTFRACLFHPNIFTIKKDHPSEVHLLQLDIFSSIIISKFVQNPKIPALTNRPVSFEPIDQITSKKDLTHPLKYRYVF